MNICFKVKMASAVAWISLVLVIVIIGLVIAIYYYFFTHRNDIILHGINFTIQVGSATVVAENMVTGGNNMYIGNSVADVHLTIATNSNNRKGQIIAVKNNSTKTITLQAGSGLSLDLGQLNAIVPSGGYAQLVSLTNGNSFLRLQ